MTAVVLRIKFPPTYPLIYKTIRLNGSLTVAESIQYIGETLHVAAPESIGLFVPGPDVWLKDNVPLMDEMGVIQDAVRRRPRSLAHTHPHARLLDGGDHRLASA